MIAKITRTILVGIATVLASVAYAACDDKPVFVFSAYWCTVCHDVERYLDSNGIAYKRIEVADNPSVKKFMLPD